MTVSLVTGATGFTGGHLAQRLAQRGEMVRGFVRPTANATRLADAGVSIVEGDLTDPTSISTAVEGVDTIYHIAAVYRSAKHSDDYYWDVNVGGTERILAAARRHGVKRVVHCSTIGVHGGVNNVPADETAPFAPGDIYQETKLSAERLARLAFRADLRGVVVRPAGIYGPGDMRFLKLFSTIRNGSFRMFGSGETFIHLVYIDDLVDGMLLCAETDSAIGNTYILAGEEFVTLNELSKMVASATGAKTPTSHLPYWPLHMAAIACEGICRPFRIEPPLHRRRAEFFVKNRAFSIDRAKRELGYKPVVDLQTGIAKTAQWYESQGLV
ncbi:MAG: NAD-dependent epimerase/dehydratase family protein [Planctomycetales bacterium]|nr:NAD-dependent epimerase/dehydratase family protein [Planctomycetales bacterium]